MNVLDFLWPHEGKMQPDETLKRDLKQVSSASWGEDTVAFLEEARRLRDVENGRKNAAETKSQIYLAALLALIPILVSLTEHDALKGIMAFDTWFRILGFILFALGLVYGIAAFVSSFRALTVSVYNRVDVDEIVSCGVKKNALGDLTKAILKTVRKDRSIVNHKVTLVIITHKRVVRMAFLLLSSLLLITFATPAGRLLAVLKATLCR